MKYIKNFETIDYSNSKFKINDYVISNKTNRYGIIHDIVYYTNTYEYAYCLEGVNGLYEGIYDDEEFLRLMTIKEIEQYKLEKLTNKFNI